MWYNEEIKREYINENITRNNHMDTSGYTVFKRSAEEEERLETDLCNFTVKQIIDYYKSLGISSLESLMISNSAFKLYTEWCIRRGMVSDNQNHYEEIDLEILKSCLNMALVEAKIISRKEMENICDNLLNPSDAFLVMALFEGICGKEMTELSFLTINDFNIEDKTVTLISGRTIPVSSKLIELAKESYDTAEYCIYRFTEASLDDTRHFTYEDDGDGVVLKRLYNASYSDNPTTRRKRLYNKLIRIQKETNCAAITQKSLLDSGRIDYIVSSNDEPDILIESEPFINKYGSNVAPSRWLFKYAELINKHKEES